MLKTFFQPLIAWYLGALKSGGLPLVVLLMTMESSFLPLPSEVIIPPAAHLAWSGDGLNLFRLHLSGWPAQIGLVMAGAFGSWLGATAMYWAARAAGRPLVLRYGRLVLFPPDKLEKAECWMAHYGAMGVFVARLLPGARQLVGLPAGIARMDYGLFSAFTILGATIWCAVLCYVGVKAGQDEQLMHGELHHLAAWLGGAALVLGGLYYFFVHRHLGKHRKALTR
ncbi:MAG TPA: DedA family protein [Verrucomicrobiae bacterium]|jgi:membrane protein DedA with SNARE-associated domain|nr:DedA family protein [Verrucomicrobiae bacterium]